MTAAQDVRNQFIRTFVKESDFRYFGTRVADVFLFSNEHYAEKVGIVLKLFEKYIQFIQNILRNHSERVRISGVT
jgi:hypothetical protein